MKKNDDKFIVSQEDAEKIATLFSQGIGDYDSIVKVLNWDNKKNKMLLEFFVGMNYINMDALDSMIYDEDTNFEETNNNPVYVVPEESYSEFLSELPIQYKNDFWDHNDYVEFYNNIRDFLIKLNSNKKTNYLYDSNAVDILIGQAFTPFYPRPENLFDQVKSMMLVRLGTLNKDKYTFNEILEAFDKAFAVVL